jgi:hypothetical protein
MPQAYRQICGKTKTSLGSAVQIAQNARPHIVCPLGLASVITKIIIAQSLPTLLHLHLRYCKRLTDNGVNAIASGLKMLYSLDLSFCTKVTVASICTLLDLRRETLSELRLQECRQLLIARDPEDNVEEYHRRGQEQVLGPRPDRDGQLILRSLRSPSSSLSMLDLRCCGGQRNINVAYLESENVVRGMMRLNFQQKTPGFFARPAQWNASIQASVRSLILGKSDRG